MFQTARLKLHEILSKEEKKKKKEKDEGEEKGGEKGKTGGKKDRVRSDILAYVSSLWRNMLKRSYLSNWFLLNRFI